MFPQPLFWICRCDVSGPFYIRSRRLLWGEGQNQLRRFGSNGFSDLVYLLGLDHTLGQRAYLMLCSVGPARRAVYILTVTRRCRYPYQPHPSNAYPLHIHNQNRESYSTMHFTISYRLRNRFILCSFNYLAKKTPYHTH